MWSRAELKKLTKTAVPEATVDVSEDTDGAMLDDRAIKMTIASF